MSIPPHSTIILYLTTIIMERIVLSGANDDQRAELLLKILRERELSVEELKEIMPTTKEFINSLMTH